MTMEVRKYVQALDSLKTVLDRFEARIESEEESRHSYRVQNQFTIRMAPEKLESLMVAIEAIGIDVDNKSINSRDVTARYVDLETRLASKRAVIQRYREILKNGQNGQRHPRCGRTLASSCGRGGVYGRSVTCFEESGGRKYLVFNGL
jgi:hypothetical protein